MKKLSYKILSHDSQTQAKVGEITTSRGIITTPAFVPVATLASIKSLTPDEVKNCKIDVIFVNTYHMIFRPGVDKIKSLGGLHTFMNWHGPIMTDSSGFQAFSLSSRGPRQNTKKIDELVTISDNGIEFKSIWDGKTIFLGPKEATEAQQKMQSDIMMAFDECTFYPIKKFRAKKALERTHAWAQKCLDQKVLYEKNQSGKNRTQALYGIVQGSVYKDLRQKSAEFIASLPFDGYAIGSVANSQEPREKVFSVLDWTMPVIIKNQKPIHFLGIGEIEDIFVSIGKGIDSFDCVIPTRLGRMGWIFTKESGIKNKFRYDITKSAYSLDSNPPDKNCQCYTCKNYSRAYIHHLFRCRELLSYKLASHHNLYFYGNLMEKIRSAITESSYKKLMNDWLEIS